MDRNPVARTEGSLAVAASRAAREVRIRPARRIDLLAHFAGAFDVAEEQQAGHAARVAYLAHRVAEMLGMGVEAQARVLHAGLLHASGLTGRPDGPHAEAGAWVAARFDLDAQVQDALRGVHERWDGRGRPAGLSGTEIPLEALCVSAAHWACEYADHVDHPLRARRGLQRAQESELTPLVGAHVADALRAVLRDDETWLALWGEDVAGVVARLGVGEGKPSRRRVQETAAAMGAVIDAAVREPGRAARVSTLAQVLAARLGLGDGVCEAVALAGYVMDIGQLGVPRTILAKPSILTVDEMELMRRHPGLGAKLIEGIPGFEEVTSWVEQHHERPDGRGYPEMLGDADLPLPPRILAVADAYWALRAARPFRAALDPAEALETLQAQAGRQFDGDVVAVLPGALLIADEVLAGDAADEAAGG